MQQLLTTAFDGEATNEALAQAHLHMAECSHCAQSWAEWEKTRIHLRSVAVPAVPSSLLTRILLACRLMPVHGSDPVALPDDSTHTMLIQYVEAINDESATASLSSIMTPVAVPPDLHRLILQATCEAAPARNPFAFLHQWLPAAPTSRKAIGWGMGLAVPAMTAWFILAGQFEDNAQLMQGHSVANNTNKSIPTSSVNSVKNTPAVAANIKPALKPLVKQAVVAAKALPRIAAVAATQKQVGSDEDEPFVRRTIAATTSSSEFEKRQPRIVAVTTRPPATVAPPRRVRLQTRPAINLIENRPSRFVLAASKRPISRLPLQAAPQISHPPVALAPRFARVSESDFDEAFIAVTAARDNRPAEIGLAFDEYRAALLSDTVDTEEITEDL